MKTVTVGDLGKIITGKTPPTKDKDNYGGDISFITPVDMVGNRKAFLTERNISKKGLNTVKNCFLPEHSVCVSCIGSDMGKAVITVKPSVTNQQINSIIVDEEAFDYLYVYYLMRILEEKIKSLGKNSTAVPILNKTKFSNIEISIFEDIGRQKAISSILSAYDDLIENNQKQIKLLEEMAQRLYKEWFINLRFPGYEEIPIVDGVPKGWAYKPLSDLLGFVRGKSYTSKELTDSNGVLMVNLKNIRAFGGYNRNAEKRFTGKYKNEQSLNHGDLVMAVTDMTQERRLVGHVAIVPDFGEPMTFSMDLIKLLPVNIQKTYLYSALFYGGFSYKISPLANGVNVLHLKPEAMMNLQMLVPEDKLMDMYGQKFDPIQSRIEVLQKQIENAKEARDRLLPKLMSGEIEV